MSATNRGGDRRIDDTYYTPPWCVRALPKSRVLPGGRWLEPAAGRGDIVRAVNAIRGDVEWDLVDIQRERGEDWKDILHTVRRWPGFDFTLAQNPDRPRPWMYAVVISNPPFSLAEEFVVRALRIGDTVAMLLRLNWLASAKRNALLTANTPSIFVLPRRPSFTDDGKVDATDYAWMVWSRDLPATVNIIKMEDCRDDE
jgi:hypothetical protein